MAKKKKLRKSYRKKANRTMRKVQAVSFMLMIALGFLLSWIFPLRPTQSESEKRELTAFPSFSFKTLWDGTFFDNISLWYSDTFPFREAMVGANSKIHSLYGFGNQVYGVSDAVMDEIPQEGDESDVPAADVFKQEDIQEGLGGRIAAGQGVVQDLGVIVIVDDAAYELYSFSKGIADKRGSR